MKVLSITRKDLSIFIRDRGAVLSLFLLPLLFIVVLPWAYSQSGSSEEARLNLLVVNQDLDGEASQTLLETISQVEDVALDFFDLDEAQTMLENGENDHLLVIPSDFSHNVETIQPASVRLISGEDVSEADTATLLAFLEGATKDLSIKSHVIASLEQIGEMQAASPPDQQVFTKERNIAQAESQFADADRRALVIVEQRVPSEVGEQEELDMAQVSVPGVAVLFVFLTAQATALSIFTEKKEGSFRRLLAAPMRRMTLMMGKLLPNYLLTLIQMAVIFAAAVFLFPLLGLGQFWLGNDPLGLVVVVALVSFCSTSLGVLIVALARTENQISGFSSALLWIMGFVGGSFIPTFFLSGFLGTVSKVVPHYWANKAFNDLLVRGMSLGDIGQPLLVLLGFTAVFLLVGLWQFDFD